ncbi:WD40 repeat-like protein [Linnemannia elongata AG-77]|uniref:DNA damage-binding protein CMR1 n=1 Tax=Linnemannia elongata AG-77 TaxID=1314771 RepID=A0A197K692_9FUNG|nr:WD40 repeat-like protein [Linnemannia elongata AG-77]
MPVHHDSDNETDSHAQDNTGLSEYEKMRLENIRRNQEAMRMFELPEAVSAVGASRADRNKRSAPTPGLKKEKRVKHTEVLPRRTSNRLANIAPDSAPSRRTVEPVADPEQIKRMRRDGTLSLKEISNGHGDDFKFSQLMEELATYVPDKARVKDLEDLSDDDSATIVKKEAKKEVKKEEEDININVKKEEADDKVKKEETEDKDTKVGIRKYFSRSSAANTATPAATTPDKKAKPGSAAKDTTKTSLPKSEDADNKPSSSSSSKGPSLRRQVQALQIRGPWPTVKVCQGRIYCMAIHENRDKILVCGGDVDGNLGFWDLDESQADDYEPDEEEEPNIYNYKAHSRTLSSMQYSPTEPNKLFSTSYDGSVRYLDLVQQKFLESYVVAPDASDHLGSVSITSSGQQLWFADVDGGVTLKDIRTPKDEMVYRKILHEKKVGCVNVNPKFDNLIVTSSLDRTMKIWDIRTFGQYKEDEAIVEMASFEHRLSVTSAMWSPDGSSIASTSYDDNVRIFNNFEPSLPDFKEIPEPVRIPHNNQSGRWVTMLRAVWSHQFNWFSIGNMNKSVDIYSRGTGDLMANLSDRRNLTTVPAVNAWHPNRVLLASGMANGKMVIWR